MNRDLGLRILADLLGWKDDQARDEYRWLRVMSYLKYDGYQDFVAGKRFIESLISWLKQFPSPEERAIAYDFIRRRLVFLGPAEMQHLVRLTYPECIRRRMVDLISAEEGIEPYEVWTNPDAREALDRLRRQTLFVGLSDGARIDVFRRANVGILSNEQIVAMPQFDDNKWGDLLEDLRRDSKNSSAQFQQIVLLDDFVGSGNSLLRYDSIKEKWKGKLVRFIVNAHRYGKRALVPKWRLLVHHYAAGSDGVASVSAMLERRKADENAGDWCENITLSFTTTLPATLKVDPVSDRPFVALIDKYYDPSIETEHTKVGGDSAKFGFADCALPVILEHNTPNNSIALLWAESAGAAGAHPMRPLFRRRQRHQ